MDKRCVRYAFDMKKNHYYRNIQYNYYYYKCIEHNHIPSHQLYIKVLTFDSKSKRQYLNYLWKWDKVVEVDKEDIMAKML